MDKNFGNPYDPYNEIVEEAKKTAPEAAKKIYGKGTCIAPYDCGKIKHSLVKPQAPATANKECPLASYSITPVRKEGFFTDPADIPSLSDLNALCIMCPHSQLVMDQGQWILERTKFYEICLDCPVEIDREGISETSAEASMS